MPATSSVPDRTPRSCPPPCSSGTTATSRRSSSTPMPVGPPTLWPVTVIASTPLAPKSSGSWPSACTASVWNGMSCARATVGEFADRVDRADLVVGPHDGDQGDVVGVLGDRGGQGVGVYPAEVIELEPADRGALGVDQEIDHIEHRMVLEGAAR